MPASPWPHTVRSGRGNHPYHSWINPRRPELAERLKKAGLKIVDIDSLKEKANSIIGDADPLPFGDKVVGVVMNRDGSVMDVIRNIEA